MSAEAQMGAEAAIGAESQMGTGAEMDAEAKIRAEAEMGAEADTDLSRITETGHRPIVSSETAIQGGSIAKIGRAATAQAWIIV
jgi:hypothetical protein